MGTAALGPLWMVLLLPLMVCGVPTEEPTPTGAVISTPAGGCRQCCDPQGPQADAADVAPASPSALPYVLPEVRPYINITILKGDKGDRGPLGAPGKLARRVPGGPWPAGHQGRQGAGGQPRGAVPAALLCLLGGPQDGPAQQRGLPAAALRHGLREPRRALRHGGRPLRRAPGGLYFFSLNVHSWNFKETYVHVVHNEAAAVILYAQPSDRSIMQSQSVMLALAPGDRVWVRLFKRERENAVYSDDVDTYITFSGHLIKPEDD